MIAGLLPGAPPCAEALEVLSAHATFETRSFQGRPFRRDAKIDVDLRSTSTTAIASIELGVFLGASLAVIEETRVSALPTLRPRQLEGGGLAFRGTTPVFLPPGATRTVRLEKGELPLELELNAVHAKVADCRYLQAVGEVRLVSEETEGTSAAPIYWYAGIGLAVVSAGLLLRRLWR